MPTNRSLVDATILCLVALATGCSSFTNPVANGIPVRLVPDELLVEDRSQKETIPMTWLRRKPEADYKLAPGDILGVYIVGVLGEEDQLPPVLSADVADRPPSVGFPIPLRLNGTIPLPYIDPVEVEGLTVEQAQAKILKAYTVDTEILKPGEASILVTLASPRQAQILVIREDSQVQSFGGTGGGIGGFASIPQRGSGTGSVVELPATKADVLEVLTRSGGLPQGNSADEVIIQRGYAGENRWPLDSDGNYCAMPVSDGSDDGDQASGRPQFTRIPLRLRPGTQPPFKPADVTLEDGDIVVVPAGELQVYYTGGLLFSREIPLPQDESLRVVEAVLRSQGSFLNGGIVLAFGGSQSLRGLGNPSPSLLTVLRHTEDGHQFPIRVDLNRAARDARENLIVGPGDVLVLQETPQEAFARYVSQMFGYSFTGRVPNRQDATGVISGSVP